MMLDDFLPPPFSAARIASDQKQLYELQELIQLLQIPFDGSVSETLHKLGDLTGSREFYPLYSDLHHLVMKLKWAREGIWQTGYAVPWMNLYSSLNLNNHNLARIAHLHGNGQGSSSSSSSKDTPTYMKLPINTFGNGCRPVELNSNEWYGLLQTSLLGGVKALASNPQNRVGKRLPTQPRTFRNGPHPIPSAAFLSHHPTQQTMHHMPTPNTPSSLPDGISTSQSTASASYIASAIKKQREEELVTAVVGTFQQQATPINVAQQIASTPLISHQTSVVEPSIPVTVFVPKETAKSTKTAIVPHLPNAAVTAPVKAPRKRGRPASSKKDVSSIITAALSVNVTEKEIAYIQPATPPPTATTTTTSSNSPNQLQNSPPSVASVAPAAH